MTVNELIPELLKLNPEETLRVIDVLQQHLKQSQKSGQAGLVEGAVYEVWAPMITGEDAKILQELLKATKEKHG